jgi:hypothetical protein
MSPGKKRTRVLCGLLVVLCAFAGLLLWTIARVPAPPTNPLYNGVPLSKHLYTIYAPRHLVRRAPGPYTPQEIARLQAEHQTRLTKWSNARTALGGQAPSGWVVQPSDRSQIRVGPEALPLLTNWLASAPPTGWRLALGQRLSRFVNLPALTADHRQIAWSFLAEFPVLMEDPDLAIFLPGLTHTNVNIRLSAAAALARQLQAGMKIEKDKAMRLLFPASSYHIAAEQSIELHRSFSYSGLQPSEQQIRSIIDGIDPRRDLIPLYTLEMGHIAARVGAAMELTEKPRYTERAIPLLINNLSSSNRSVQEKCAVALGAYGAKSRAALPALTNLLDHPKERVRLAASNAIVAIKSDE